MHASVLVEIATKGQEVQTLWLLLEPIYALVRANVAKATVGRSATENGDCGQEKSLPYDNGLVWQPSVV